MARTTLAVQSPKITGLNPTFSAANADGHTVANRGRTVLHVRNGGGGSINVTVQTRAVSGRAVADDVIAVPASGERIIGPLNERIHGSAVLVDFSGVTTVTVAALTL